MPSRPRQPEAVLKAQVRLALGLELDLALWVNARHDSKEWDPNTGGVRFAVGGLLAPGSSDLIGLLAPTGRFVALEVKVPGGIPSAARLARIAAKPDHERSKGEQRDHEQATFLAIVRRLGGFGSYVDSVPAALAALERARRGEAA